jgi:hypothetical protein
VAVDFENATKTLNNRQLGMNFLTKVFSDFGRKAVLAFCNRRYGLEESERLGRGNTLLVAIFALSGFLRDETGFHEVRNFSQKCEGTVDSRN